MKKRIKAQEEKNVKSAAPDEPSKTPLPQYLLDRSQETNAKALSSAIKNKRNEKAAKFAVPLPKVKGISEEEMFKVVNTGKKTHKKSWKRMITKPTFVGNDFTRRPVKYERFIRPMGLRYKKCNVTQYVSPFHLWGEDVFPSGFCFETVLTFSAPVPSWLSLCNFPFFPSRRTPRTLSTHSWVF
jgi:ribosomal protein S8E